MPFFRQAGGGGSPSPSTPSTLAAQGLLAETYSRIANITQALLTGGRVYYALIALPEGETVTGLCQIVQTAGVAMTLSKIGLYDIAGNRLAISADQGAAWESIGLKQVPFTAPLVVPAGDAFYTALVASGGTLPQFFCGSTNAGLAVAAAGGVIPFATLSGQVDLTDPAVITAATTPRAIWHGAY